MRDFAQVMSNGVITLETARTALDRLEIDELGLDRNDRRMLEAIVRFTTAVLSDLKHLRRQSVKRL